MTYDAAIDEVMRRVKMLLLAKRSDYGMESILANPVVPTLAQAFPISDVRKQTICELNMLSRLGEKVSRLSNCLVKRLLDQPINFETPEVAWDDLIGYSVIGALLEAGMLGLPLKGKETI